MRTITRIKQDNRPLIFNVSLKKVGKTLQDVSDAYFIVKNVETESDTAVFSRQRSLGQILTTGTDVVRVEVNWDSTEYTAFQVNKMYKAGVFFKFQGDDFVSENVDQLYYLIIKQDFVRA